MTAGKLVELLTKAMNDGAIDPKGEILAATVNGCFQVDEDQLMETVDQTRKNGIYILISHPEDDANTIFYTVNKTEEN